MRKHNLYVAAMLAVGFSNVVYGAEAQGADAKSPSADGNTVRVPYLSETAKQEITEQIRQEVMARAKQEGWAAPGQTPEWVQRIKLSGDVRFRGQNDKYQDDNSDGYYDIIKTNAAKELSPINTLENRARLRVRARLGVAAKVTDGVDAALRLVTGSSADPVSTNQTLGNSNNRFNFMLDRAYLRYAPKTWFMASAGRLPNPWFGSDLVWDDDLNFDGIAVSAKHDFNAKLGTAFTMGAFPLQEIERTPDRECADKWLFGAQSTWDWNSAEKIRLKAGLGYYYYTHVLGRTNTTGSSVYDCTKPDYAQKGNTLMNISGANDPNADPILALASEFQEINFTMQGDVLVAAGTRVIALLDYVTNAGYDKEAVQSRKWSDSPEGGNQGYHLKLTVGKAELLKPHDWQAFFGVKRLESDAVFDAFTDSDFHLGGTDAKGWYVGGGYNFAYNTTLGLRWLSANEIAGDKLAIDTIQLDVSAKF
jgi:hypothetical protein